MPSGESKQNGKEKEKEKMFSFKTLRLRAQRWWVVSYWPLLMSNSELEISPLQQADLKGRRR